MGLKLHALPAAQGWQWVRQGLALWAKRPLGFAALFATYLMAALFAALLLPVVGGILGLALLPMLSLGYMVAARGALQGARVSPLQLLDGLRHPDRSRRKAQWLLCAGYAAGSVLVVLLSHAADGGAFEELQRLLAEPKTPGSTAALDKLLADPRLVQGMVLRLGLAGLLSVPFWHAAALVHWGGQGALQAVFSSSLAVWRSRGAFVVYLGGWVAIMVATAVAMTLLAVLTGATALVGALMMPTALVFTAAFYVSLWFCYRDSFEPDPPSDTMG